ncbi:uncharacterized protein [Littorina saxatilis]|uniref:uncharacterized protein n=1 Tax=Littorina saxatilis TaxID=31220 RepID=UPI0038B65273
MSYVYYCAIVVQAVLTYTMLARAAQPTQRQDVMGSYTLSNEKQCQRLCWYRPLCTSYSYFTGVTETSGGSDSQSNCVLHTTSVEAAPANALEHFAGWSEKGASNTDISNTCRNRQCDQRSVCIPNYSTSSPVCLLMPSQCGTPGSVSNGDVIVLHGKEQDDVAQVQCDDAYEASPRDVSVDLRCQVTSAWTAFQGTCIQYEYNFYTRNINILQLPWSLTENSSMCIQVLDYQAGQYYLNLIPSLGQDQNEYLHFSMRYQFGAYNLTEVLWNVKKNGNYGTKRYLGVTPLVPGDSFNLTLHVQSDRLQLVLNETHVYDVPLFGVDGADISQSTMILLAGDGLTSYVNLISGC